MKQQLFGRLQKATHKAFDRMARVGDIEADPDIRLYDTLEPQHFTELIKQYGEQSIIDYIKDMEGRRVMRRK